MCVGNKAHVGGWVSLQCHAPASARLDRVMRLGRFSFFGTPGGRALAGWLAIYVLCVCAVLCCVVLYCKVFCLILLVPGSGGEGVVGEERREERREGRGEKRRKKREEKKIEEKRQERKRKKDRKREEKKTGREKKKKQEKWREEKKKI